MSIPPSSHAVSRRTVLASGGVAGLGALLGAGVPTSSAAASPPGTAGPQRRGLPRVTWSPTRLVTFDAAVRAAFSTFGLIGASVALFQSNRIVYNRGFGRRDIVTRAPVTTRTRFRIGSNTKSMTSLLIARYVDQGLTTWDTKVIDLWPAFVGPSSKLTRSLTLHQLLGMGSGIAEPGTIEFFASGGGVDAEQLLQTVPHLEVIAKNDEKYYYNNTLVAAAPYLVMLADGTEPSRLQERYAADMASLIFGPIGMADAVVAADPRPFGPDHATGYQRDLEQRDVRVPFVSIGGYGPAGSVQASSTDMARYLITQSQLGIAPNGVVVASRKNVRRTHQPGVLVPPDSQNGLPSPLLVDTRQTNYDLGWFDEVFYAGERMLWHAGGIDGFGSLMGFLPDYGVGFVALTNYEPSIGGLFNFSVQATFLDVLLGLNSTIPEFLATIPPITREHELAAAKTARPVDSAAVAAYTGLYSDGFSLQRRGDELLLRHDIRTMRVRAVDTGGYLVVDGSSAVSGRRLVLATDRAGTRTLTIDGFDPVQWLTGD